MASHPVDSTEFDHIRRVTTEGNLRRVRNSDGSHKWGSGGKTPKKATTVTIKYFVRDNVDNAEAEARYILHVHEPIELISSDTSIISYLSDYKSSADGSMVTVGYPNDIGGNYEMGTSQSSGWSVSSTIGVTFDDLAVPLGWEILSAEYGQSGDESQTEVAPAPLDADGNSVVLNFGEEVHLRIRHKYVRSHSTFWQYSGAGKDKRYNSGHSGESIEIPHEAIRDHWIDNEFVWSDPYQAQFGLPDIPQEKRQLPEKSYNYALKEVDDAQPLA